ncbi:hypothetical protein LINPERHAP1_LOCUS34711, partial [Linum perenne]
GGGQAELGRRIGNLEEEKSIRGWGVGKVHSQPRRCEADEIVGHRLYHEIRKTKV